MSTGRRLSRTGLLTLCISSVALGTGWASASPADTGAPAVLHVDCGAGAGGNGSAAHPWNSLSAASSTTLLPGQQLLFARGTTCQGLLALHGSGGRTDPVVVGAYGSGPLPRLRGSGADTVLLENEDYVTVRDLEITNPAPSDTQRRGVHVVADGVTVRGITLEDLDVHAVNGNLSKDTGGSGGIQLDALGTAPFGRFAGVRIDHNRVDRVSRSGIFVVGTQDSHRPPSTSAWPNGSTKIVIKDNWLDHLAGDGIVATGTVGAVLEGNHVSDGNRAGTQFTSSSAICDAGIWTWNANNTLIEHNEVAHMEFNGCDGTGYDVDYNQDGTIIQDNVSLENAGGFILLCTDSEPHMADVRYNLSVNDASTFNEAPCDIGAGNVGSLSGIRLYNNTIVAPKAAATLELNPLSSLFDAGTFRFVNNIVDATSGQTNTIPCGSRCSHNLFYGLPPSGGQAVVGNPRFRDPSVTASPMLRLAKGYQVAQGSPAVNAGKPIVSGAKSDFFGDPLPAGQRPTIGFFELPARS